MICIAVTREDFHPGEAAAIGRILADGVIDRVHIRKPGADSIAVEALIRAIDSRFHSRLSLHSHHGLATRYGAGVHLNVSNPYVPAGFEGIVSRSCHSLEELALPADYCFLSPIFDSISKTGYCAAFSPEALAGRVDRHVMALGGVRPEYMPKLYDIGFGGVAFLGYLWNGDISENIKEIEKYKKLCCNL